MKKDYTTKKLSLDSRTTAEEKQWSERGQIHLFQKFDRYFAIDVGTGVVIELDELSWKIATKISEGNPIAAVKHMLKKDFSEDDVYEAFKELSELYENGEFFSKDFVPQAKSTTTKSINGLCLMMSGDCNLRCDYCFAVDANSTGRKGHMPKEVAHKAVDFLLANARASKELSVSFFGGEPLLNFPVVESTVIYALEKAKTNNKRIRFNITTNVTLLNKTVRDFLAKHPEITLILSIDGGAEIHNRYRCFADGRRSFAVVRRNILSLLGDNRIDPNSLSVRGTFTGISHDLVTATSEILALGLKDISIEPAIVRAGELEISEKQLEAIKKDYDQLALFYLDNIKNGKPFRLFHFEIARQNVAFPKRMYKPCSAGTSYLAVDIDGTIYPCHRFIGDSNFVMGNLNGHSLDKDLSKLFTGALVISKEKCRSCWARYYCGGGCHRHGYEFNGDIHNPYDIECELMRHRIELGAYLHAILTDDESMEISELNELSIYRPEYDRS